MFAFASRRGSASIDPRVEAAQRELPRRQTALELGQVRFRVRAGERPGLRDRPGGAQLAQQLRRHERAVDREEDRELGRGRAQPGDDARDRRSRLGRLDDDVERQLEVALADREPQRERLAEDSPATLRERLAPEARQRLRRAEALRRAADEQHAGYVIRHVSV